ncbi:hypothetical protein SDC9_157722 [bioreactor metagenome]|uniref:Uncharacterized protein n=1 Tax=bioreactor metagenome TaxID=1076179 RepID=A0A645F867_9ZZZZ
MVGEIAHRVQGLPGRTGGDQHPKPAHILLVGKGVEHGLQQVLRLRHLALTHGAAGQTPAGRFHDFPAVVPQQVQIVLGDPVIVHTGVHGRGGDLGAVAGQHGGGQHVVGQAVGQLSQHVGRGGRHQDQVGLVGQGDMLYLVLVSSVEGIYHGPVSGEGLEGQRGDKFGGVGRHQHMDVCPLLYQGGRQPRRLKAGDAAGDTQQHSFSVQHIQNLNSRYLNHYNKSNPVL